MKVEKRNSHPLLIEMLNGAATMEGSLAVSYKGKHSLNTRSRNYVPSIYPKELNEELCPYKNFHSNVYNSFIHNYQKLEATKMLFNR